MQLALGFDATDWFDGKTLVPDDLTGASLAWVRTHGV